MQAGIAAGRTIFATTMAAALVAALLFIVSGPSARADHGPNLVLEQVQGSNDALYWETWLSSERGITADCVKLDEAGDEAFELDQPPAGEVWVLLVVKQSTFNFLFFNPTGGHAYASTGQQGPGYSHTIMCSAEPTTTTTEGSTTTSLDVGATSTSAGPTTTTGGPTTTIDTATTTVPTTTTTLGDEVLGTTITTSGPTTTVANVTGSTFEDEVLDQEILPFTGFAFEGLIIVASALALLGALLLSTRSQLED